MKKIYISGPMTGIKNFNHPVFNAAEKLLKTYGFLVINPARHPIGLKHEQYMKYAMLDVENADALVLLPGFESSRCSLAEIKSAIELGKNVYEFGEFAKCHLN